MLRRQVTLLKDGDLREYLLRQILIFGGVTDKFRINVDDEAETAKLIADIGKLDLLHPDVFDITPKKYGDGWSVRISWTEANKPLVEEVLTQAKNLEALPLARRETVHIEDECGTLLEGGICPKHHFVPSLQETAIAFYCRTCPRELGQNNVCPACKQQYRKY